MDKANDETNETPTIIGTHSESDSIASLSIGDTWESTNCLISTQIKSTEEPQESHTPTSLVPAVPDDISPTVTNITEQMENDIKNTIRDICLGKDDISVKASIRQYIDSKLTRLMDQKHTSLVNFEQKVSQIDKLCTEIGESKNNLETLEDQYKKGSEKIHTRLHWINSRMMNTSLNSRRNLRLR